jgi:DNA-directed RNA polymerase subunit RPC12/RpoP
MAESDLKIRCQRCGEQMEMKDPAPGADWRPDQFWVCPKCGRHFWTTYATQPGVAAPAAAPAKPAAPSAPAAAPATPAQPDATKP